MVLFVFFISFFLFYFPVTMRENIEHKLHEIFVYVFIVMCYYYTYKYQIYKKYIIYIYIKSYTYLINETFFRWLGRFDNIINSGGVKIIPEVVEAKLAPSILDRRYFITGISDESLGEKMILIVEGDVIDISFDSLEKYEKLKEIHFISKFEETESGKVNRIETLKIKKLYVPIHRGA